MDNKKKKRSNRTSSYAEFKCEVRDKGIDWPINLKDVPKFAKMNGYVLFH